jgi:hypothetical protein
MSTPDAFRDQGNDALFLRNASPNIFIFSCLAMAYIMFKVNYKWWVFKLKDKENSNIYKFFHKAIEMF